MTCEEFQQILPELGSGSSTAKVAHLRSCSQCAGLLADLNEIARQSKQLQASDEPPGQVWQSIFTTLQDEGLIREKVEVPLAAPVYHVLGDAVHVRSCTRCAGVLADLDAISEQARLLKATEEPSPRVWASIEIALRREGLIRDRQSEAVEAARATPSWSRWKLAWLVPLAAAAALALGTLIFQHGDGVRNRIVKTDPKQNVVTPEQQQMVALVAPEQRDAYEADLRAVDEYIQDAESSANANPGDAFAHQRLVSAYEQRAMMYEMAMNRSLR
ncbi:MAG TPA: hypothetical protein VF753_00570 [Terriglobales bacterium]